jgi:NTP pyrophosphatase (non-canonical NTP hydrolase)
MTHPAKIALLEAVGDAQRGHRITEWESAARRLAAEAMNYVAHVEEKRAEAPKTLEQMQTEVTEWCERKGWKGEGSAPVTFGDTMALLHSEVSEALEAYRDWGLADATGVNHLDMSGLDGVPPKPEGVGSEFADVLIRLLDDCDRWGVDLRFEFERKMAYNEKRPFQHGGRIL